MQIESITVPVVTDPNEAAITDWLRLFVSPGQIVELRALNVKRSYGKPATVSGFYDSDHLHVAAKDALKLTNKGMDGKPAPGVYFVFNPINPDLLARRANRCEIADAGSLTHDQDITSRRWILIDVDPVRASAISASDEEKACAEDVCLAVYQHLREAGWPKPLIVDSGNGWHLYYRVELPVDDGELVKSVLYYLADKFDTPRAKVDTSVFNPARISKLPGTKGRKGDDIAGRPHRWSKVFNVPDVVEVVPVAAIELFASQWRAVQEQKTRAPIVTEKGMRLDARKVTEKRPAKSVLDRARAYLDQMGPAYEDQRGGRHTLNAACRLVRGFTLSIEDAFQILSDWNQRCVPPWTEQELRHKLDQAAKSTEELGSLINAPLPRTSTGTDADDVYEIDDPRRLALLFLDRHCTATGQHRFLRWCSEWYLWNFQAYQAIASDAIESRVTNLIQTEFEIDAMDRLERYEKIPESKRDEKSKPPTARKVTITLVKNVLSHLSALTITGPEIMLPSWIRNQPAGFDPRECIAAKNGIVNLRKLTTGESDYLMPASPDYFSTSCLPFDFDEHATQPVEWLRFLNDLWPNDPESIECLQEWMGLLLVPDNRLGKMLLMVGPPRSGKGTIAKVIQALIGTENVAAPTLAGLATNFGLWSLIGKQVAIVGDARLSPKTDTAIIAERLLSISGDDAITIDRKNLPPITTTLTTRIVILTNQIPQFTDASSALAKRFITLRMTNSFLGQEDIGLSDRLLRELPSILAWAIVGWQRLMENGRFTIPNASQEITTQLEDSASPISAFIRERCDTSSPDFKVVRKQLFEAWEEWCTEEGRVHCGNMTSFGIHLRAAVPSIWDAEIRTFGIRQRAYGGIKLREFANDPKDLGTGPQKEMDF